MQEEWEEPVPIRIGGFCVLISIALSPDVNASRQQRAPRPMLMVNGDTRLLVVAPHPDDEVLGAGGLMQRVHTARGVVRVVYLTDGDRYPEGVRVADHVEVPTAKDYRGYGQQRK